MSEITIEFNRLEFGTKFKSWSGVEWIKLNEDYAIEPDDDIDNPETLWKFESDEMVTVA